MSSDELPTQKLSTKHSSFLKPEAEYQQIIQNPDVFLQKLQAFHLFYGTKFRVPTLGGKELDLHRLFLEVTSRGGIEKVIRDRKWKEVKEAFNFPSTSTSGSTVLQRHYLSLLYQFEQFYYLRKEEPRISTAVPHNLEDDNLVTGTIDAKFDSGYVVTIKLGAEEFKGVIYHAPPGETKASQNSNTSSVVIHHIRRKRQVAAQDPSRPKRSRSGYTYFFAEQYHRLRPSYEGQERAISKKIGDLWSGLTDAEKQLVDKERYKAEMSEYKSSQHLEEP